jgi:hypothetical protein
MSWKDTATVRAPCDRDVGRAIGMVTSLVQAYTGTGDDG